METGDEWAVKREELLTTFKAEELLLSPTFSYVRGGSRRSPRLFTHLIADKGCSRKLAGCRARKGPGCREPRRKVGLAL